MVILPHLLHYSNANDDIKSGILQEKAAELFSQSLPLLKDISTVQIQIK